MEHGTPLECVRWGKQLECVRWGKQMECVRWGKQVYGMVSKYVNLATLEDWVLSFRKNAHDRFETQGVNMNASASRYKSKEPH
jgi:hypothetical protein